MINEELEEDENSTFMANTKEYPCDDAWYMDGDATNHMKIDLIGLLLLMTYLKDIYL